MKSIFDFSHYRPYLLVKLGGKNRRTGQRSAAAHAIRCHATFISLVLAETAHLNLEQAFEMNEYLGHPKLEAEYFLQMVQKDRAGTSSLKSYFQKKMDDLREKRTEIKDRIRNKNEISEVDQARFYSDWIYGAIHVLASIPDYQSIEAIATHLKLPKKKTHEAVEFLLKLGLLHREGNRLKMSISHIHLGSDSPLLDQHHKNWRICTLGKLGHEQSKGIHYSSAVSLSRADVKVIQESLMQTLQSHLATIVKSKEEALYCYSFDFFEI